MESNKKLVICTSCNDVRLCNEVETEYNGEVIMLNFCDECEKEIDDIIMWANEYSLRSKKEVECPYCYSVYNIENSGLVFNCEGCESTLEVIIDESGIPYIKED